MSIIKLPGLIDIHVHLRDPGQTHKEDFATGTRAAVAGGFTTIIDMPNNLEPITTLERLENKMAIACKKIVANIGFYFGSLGDNLAEFKKVASMVFGLKLYLNQTTGGFIVTPQSLEKIYTAWTEASGQPIFLHSEEDLIQPVLNVVRKTKHSSHFCHVSSKNELSQILNAKAEGLPVTCGVCPHHLFLTDSHVSCLGSYAHMKPNLKSESDSEFLWQHIGDIDCIESDHAPHTKSEKDSQKAPFGVPGLESTLPLLLTEVNEDRMELKDIVRLCYGGPKKILGLPEEKKTYIEVDVEDRYKLSGDKMFTKCRWTPFEGREVYGRVLRTVIRGNTVYKYTPN